MLGGIYALMSTGLTLLWGTVNILNFAYGAFFTLSAYTFWVFVTGIFHLNFAISMFITIIFSFFFGVIAELLIFRPLRSKPHADLNSIYSSLGLSIALEGLFILLFNPRRKRIPPIIEGSFSVAGVGISYQRLMIVIISLLTLITFMLFLKRSRYGIAMRAVAQDSKGCLLMGVNLNMIFLLTVGLSSALGGVAGVALGSIYTLYPNLGEVALMKGFVIIVFGGLGSIRGTICASFILGLVESLTGVIFGLGWSAAAIFLVMLFTLLIKPSGLFGEKI